MVNTSSELDRISTRSRIGLNAANFFQAESVGVLLPVLNGFLRDAHWSYSAIGIATALAGLGTFLMQTPAGVLTDRIQQRRTLFAVVSLLTGACFVLVPLVPGTTWPVDSLLLLSGAVQSFFAPVLGALAVALAGSGALGRLMGENQGWNHAGNIVAAAAAIGLVAWLGTSSVFYSVGAASLLGAAAVYLVRPAELHERHGGPRGDKREASWRELLSNRTVLWVLAAISLFHLANAPILPLTALYVKKLGGSNALMTATVLIAQIVMIPVAWLSGLLCDRWGRKPVLAIGFWILPLRIASYTLAPTARWVVALQALDGIGAGIYGVVSVAIAADLTRGKGRFNTLLGMLATAQAVGGVLGPLATGFLVQHLGFRSTFWAFAALALLAALAFAALVPETRQSQAKLPVPA